MKEPIYTKVWTTADQPEVGSVKVHFPDHSGETEGYTTYMKPLAWEDVMTPYRVVKDEEGKVVTKLYPPLYVEIRGEDMQYPYPTAADAVEVVEEDEVEKMVGWRHEPRKFVEAAIVAIPKMKLF